MAVQQYVLCTQQSAFYGGVTVSIEVQFELARSFPSVDWNLIDIDLWEGVAELIFTE